MEGFSRRPCVWGALEPGVCASFRCGFAPHTRESLILPLRGANILPGKGTAAEGVCASHPGKPYSTVERRKPFAGKRRRRLWGFAPHTSESLISPLRGANLLPGRGASGRVSLRLTPGKALFFRRGAQTGFPGAGAELVHGTPQSHDFPFPLHQVVGLFRRLAAPELVHETPQGLDFPFPVHQVVGLFRRLAAPELVHGTPQVLDFPFPLHQVVGLFRRLAPTFWLFTKKLRDRLIPIPQLFAKKLFFSLVLFKFYSAGLSGWISGIISTSRFR